MVKISMEFDERELIVYIKEHWYKDARRQAQIKMEQLLGGMIRNFIDKKKSEFEKMLKQALHDAAKEIIQENKELIKKVLR